MTARARKTSPARRDVSITRELSAPRSRVFQMWTEPGLLAQWWGPQGFTNPVCEVDARPGGAIRIHMRAPDGVVHPMRGTFREVAAPERRVFTTVAEDNAGNPLLEGLTTVTLAEHDGGTRLTVQSGATGLRRWRPTCSPAWRQAGRKPWSGWPQRWRSSEARAR